MAREQKRGANLVAAREAEKDLAFALCKLQEGDRVSAFMNAAAALVCLGEIMNPAEWRAILDDASRVSEAAKP